MAVGEIYSQEEVWQLRERQKHKFIKKYLATKSSGKNYKITKS
jgi:hypothetical protein